MGGSRAQIGVDVSDTNTPVIDYPTVRFLVSLVFGCNWEMFHWDASVAFTNAKAEDGKGDAGNTTSGNASIYQKDNSERNQYKVKGS